MNLSTQHLEHPSTTFVSQRQGDGERMSDDIIISNYGVKLNNLNWGYQIVHDTQVLVAIHDTVGGPRRTEECSEEARKKYELLCNVYERLYREIKPSQQQLNFLVHVIKGDTKSELWNLRQPNQNTAKSLMHRGIIGRIGWYDGYRNFAILDGNGRVVILWRTQ